MARTFTKNLANYMSLGNSAVGTILHGATVYSIAAWVNPTSFTGTAADENLVLGVIIHGNFGGLTLGIDASLANKTVRLGGRAANGEARQARSGTSNVPTGSWSLIGGVVDIAGDVIRPYFNGNVENAGAVSFLAGSYTQGTPTSVDLVGGIASGATPNLTTNQWDGGLAEFMLWRSDIGDAGFASLAAGNWPYRVTTPNWYMRILGDDSPELSLEGGLSGTITGSLPKLTHPSITTSFGTGGRMTLLDVG